MTRQSIATRRRFIRTAGAALSGPVALAVATTLRRAAGEAKTTASRTSTRSERLPGRMPSTSTQANSGRLQNCLRNLPASGSIHRSWL